MFHLISRDEGRTFEVNQLRPPTQGAGDWFANLSKAGPYHPVDRPAILFMQNIEGASQPGGRTRIYCVFVDEL